MQTLSKGIGELDPRLLVAWFLYTTRTFFADAEPYNDFVSLVYGCMDHT